MTDAERSYLRSPPDQVLTEQQQRGWTLADRLGDMISAHAPDGTYRYASAAAKDLLGYEPAELEGRWAYDFFHPDDVARVGNAHRSALKGAPFTVSYRLRRKSGDYVWVETTTRVVCDPGTDEVTEILCCTRPVGDREPVERAEHERRACVDRIHKVLTDDAIDPLFQPIVELATGRVIAFEALARFPGDRAHPPHRWFADAWKVGLGIPLELMAVRAAAHAMKRLPPDVGLCVNASPPTAASPAFLQCFADELQRVTVEITEHLKIGELDELDSMLSALRRARGKVAIDDYGAGYASLSHILRIRPDWIKLDMTLTRDIDDNAVVRALAASIASFADRTGVRVIAEGIEKVRELDALTAIGIRYGQGRYIGRPAPLDDALVRYRLACG
jgi:PAS domain S-box-containing protein